VRPLDRTATGPAPALRTGPRPAWFWALLGALLGALRAPLRRVFALWPLLLAGLAALLLILLLLWQAGSLAREAALAEMAQAARNAIALHAAALRSELEKYRALALVLARDRDVATLLDTPADATLAAAVNHKLDALGSGIRAAAIYVIGADGRALAASNWQLTTSFVGQDYAFRTYFRAAAQRGEGEQFSAGTVSQRPGYYLARRVETGARGVVVIKVEFEAIEAVWQAAGAQLFVADRHGVVLVTGNPEWRFTTLARLPPAARESLREEGQYGEAAPLTPLPLAAEAEATPFGALRRVFTPDGPRRGTPVLEVTADIPGMGWTVHLLQPLEPRLGRARLLAMLGAALALALLAASLGYLHHRRRRARQRLAENERQRRLLEERVASRTAELSASNAQLRAEVAERERAEAELRRAQNDLVQAAKLAALGQMAASIAHEVNQPLAAMRTYSDNAAVLLARGREEEAKANLATISGLTERIAQITQHLKSFGRKASGALAPVSVQSAVAAALVLLEHRLRQQGIRVSLDLPQAELRVLAEQVRLEQVLLNLLQNAADALSGVAAPALAISAQSQEGAMRITVSDNGPGVAPEDLPRLFSAFYTTKPQGLGLGLSISWGIVQDFGGCLECLPRPGGGACFLVTLKPAP